MGQPFIDFSFGSFNSESYGIVRTSDGDRYTISLAPPSNDKVVDVPGMDGSYYFGSQFKPRTFNVNFAFDNLSSAGLSALKTAFGSNELQYLSFTEDGGKIYVAKVTGEPSIKTIPFDGSNGDIIYKGEGSVQFTAYWPFMSETVGTNVVGTYAVRRSTVEGGADNESVPGSGITATTITVGNSGNIPTHFEVKSDLGIEYIEVGDVTIKPVSGVFTYWNSKTGIVKNGNTIIDYTGDGLYKIPVGGASFVFTHEAGNGDKAIHIYCNNWYY